MKPAPVCVRHARTGVLLKAAMVSGVVLFVSACSTTPSVETLAREHREDLTPATWRTRASDATGGGAGTASKPAAPAPTLPHDGHAASIAQWWRHFDDALLVRLIDDAQATSPTLTQALARVREARAMASAAGASLLPSMNFGVNATRGRTPVTSFPSNDAAPSTQGSAGVTSQWEIDLFGGLRHQSKSAELRAEQARLDWHDARVTLAADVAQTYVNLRTCEAMVAVLEQTVTSQRRHAALTQEKVRVGFEAPAMGALARASAADASNRLTAQRADCDSAMLALSVLTGRAPDALQEALTSRKARLPQPGQAFDVDRMPAAVLAQRPDIAAAEQTLAATEAEIHAASAQRWPRLVLGGSIGVGAMRAGGMQVDGLAWSFLPSLVMPIFDGGRVAAGIDSAQARRDAAYAALDQRIRLAAREVEEALMRLEAARTREADAITAADGFRDYFKSVEQRWQVGAGSLIELEDARRLALNAQAALLGLQRETVAAWISLYRATGGGWRADDDAAVPSSTRDRPRRRS